MSRYATQPDSAKPRQDAALHQRRGADAGHRHRRQYGDLQRDRGRAVEAAAVSTLRRAGRARSHLAGHQPAPSRGRAVSLLHLPRGWTGFPGCRARELGHGRRHRPGRARGGAHALRHRRHPADARRAAGARTSVLEGRRCTGRDGDGGSERGILAVEVRRRPSRYRPHADGRRPSARNHRCASRHVPVPRP